MALPGQRKDPAPLTEATLSFEEDDGRLIAFRQGRAILVGREYLGQVKPGEVWKVRLHTKPTCEIAEPVERIAAAPPAPRVVPVITTEKPAPPKPANGSAPAPVAQATAAPLVQIAAPKSTTRGPTMLQGMLVEPDNVIRIGERVAMFVDAANMNAASRALSFYIDWPRARDYFLANGHFVAAYYHAADFGEEGNQQGFFDALAHAGFIIRKKPVKVITDSLTGEKRNKANLDMEIAVDMFNAMANYDVAFLFSGDSDFERTVELLRSRGKRVYVVSSRGSLSCELLHTGDKPIFYLEDFQEIIERVSPK